MTQTALILGASGRFGRNAAEQFTKAGWAVRRFDRAHDDLNIAAKGVDVIVNGWNPGYPDWQKLVPDLTGKVIAAAKSSGATVILPGNLYVFGAGTPGPWSQTTPHKAANPLGRIRIEMEAVYRRSGVGCIVLRAGDFIDTRASGNWLDRVMLKTLPKGVFTYPGAPDIDHAWAYLPDLCRAAVELAGLRDQLPAFADIAFPGFTASGAEIAAQIGTLTGTKVRVKQMSWLPLQLARPFWRMGACLLEMRYLWDTAHQLDGDLFASLLPDFRATPLADALASALPETSVQHQINPNQPVTAGS
ncbi:MAG: epimerase [Rhodobacteraceae bacterium]|nr:epimerase [Paracoccaceae bacterium]